MNTPKDANDRIDRYGEAIKRGLIDCFNVLRSDSSNKDQKIQALKAIYRNTQEFRLLCEDREFLKSALGINEDSAKDPDFIQNLSALLNHGSISKGDQSRKEQLGIILEECQKAIGNIRESVEAEALKALPEAEPETEPEATPEAAPEIPPLERIEKEAIEESKLEIDGESIPEALFHITADLVEKMRIAEKIVLSRLEKISSIDDTEKDTIADYNHELMEFEGKGLLAGTSDKLKRILMMRIFAKFISDKNLMTILENGGREDIMEVKSDIYSLLMTGKIDPSTSQTLKEAILEDFNAFRHFSPALAEGKFIGSSLEDLQTLLEEVYEIELPKDEQTKLLTDPLKFLESTYLPRPILRTVANWAIIHFAENCIERNTLETVHKLLEEAERRQYINAKEHNEYLDAIESSQILDAVDEDENESIDEAKEEEEKETGGVGKWTKITALVAGTAIAIAAVYGISSKEWAEKIHALHFNNDTNNNSDTNDDKLKAREASLKALEENLRAKEETLSTQEDGLKAQETDLKAREETLKARIDTATTSVTAAREATLAREAAPAPAPAPTATSLPLTTKESIFKGETNLDIDKTVQAWNEMDIGQFEYLRKIRIDGNTVYTFKHKAKNGNEKTFEVNAEDCNKKTKLIPYSQ